MSELKNCPFCGGKPDTAIIYLSSAFPRLGEFDPRKPIVNVGCSHCGIDTGYRPDFWNTRPAEDAMKAEVEELRYIVKQFKEWRGDDDTGCPKYQHPDYPCAGEKEFKEKFGEDADFDTIECTEWGEGCWVEYYRWKYRQKVGTDTNVPTNAPDMNDGRMEE